MIRQIQGNILKIEPRSVIVSVQGIGYQIHMAEASLLSLSKGQEITIWTHLAVRENSMDLFGFFTEQELTFFEMLLDVSGIGPRSALGIIGIASIEMLKKAIAHNDTSHLTKVSGIGKKTAEKIVVELRDKLANYIEEGGSLELQGDNEVFEALQALGYTIGEARHAMKEISADISDTGDRIKEALKAINQNNGR